MKALCDTFRGSVCILALCAPSPYVPLTDRSALGKDQTSVVLGGQ